MRNLSINFLIIFFALLIALGIAATFVLPGPADCIYSVKNTDQRRRYDPDSKDNENLHEFTCYEIN